GARVGVVVALGGGLGFNPLGQVHGAFQQMVAEHGAGEVGAPVVLQVIANTGDGGHQGGAVAVAVKALIVDPEPRLLALVPPDPVLIQVHGPIGKPLGVVGDGPGPGQLP